MLAATLHPAEGTVKCHRATLATMGLDGGVG
jgi:hypothetical protein